MKRFVVCICVLLLTSSWCPPPLLEHDSNSCWGSAGIWLLFNMTDLVNDLIANESTYKNDKNLPLIINLLKAMRAREEAGEETNSNKKQIDDLNKQLETARADFHNNVACPITGKNPGDTGDAAELFTELIHIIPLSGNIIKNGPNLTINHDIELYRIPIDHAKKYLSNDISIWQNVNYPFNNFPIKELWTIQEERESGKQELIGFIGSNNETPVYGPIMEPTGVVYTYELIGMAVSSSGHVVAFIKDQWEKTPTWYRCDDLGKIEKINTFPTKWPNNIYPGEMPTIMIYKKIETRIDPSISLDQFAQALKDISNF